MTQSIDIKRAALIFLDFQVDVCDEQGKMVAHDPAVLAPFRRVRRDAAALLNRARQSKHSPRIVHVKHVFKPGYPELDVEHLSKMESYVKNANAFLDGSHGAEIVDELRPLQDEKVIHKCSLSPFATSDLAQWLTKRHVNTVILAGVVTHYAILATAFAAYDSGYTVVVLSDCCMSGTAETHNTALSILDPIASLLTSADIDELMS